MTVPAKLNSVLFAVVVVDVDVAVAVVDADADVLSGNAEADDRNK
jgi:hypothetical protein